MAHLTSFRWRPCLSLERIHLTRNRPMSFAMSFTRRAVLSATTTALLASPIGATAATRRFDAAARLQALEVGHARLGVCFLDTATGEVSGNRLGEHFAMCSTFKLALIAAYLREA